MGAGRGGEALAPAPLLPHSPTPAFHVAEEAWHATDARATVHTTFLRIVSGIGIFTTIVQNVNIEDMHRR